MVLPEKFPPKETTEGFYEGSGKGDTDGEFVLFQDMNVIVQNHVATESKPIERKTT